MQRTSAGLAAEGRCSPGAYSGGLEAKVWPNFSFPDNSLRSYLFSSKQVHFFLFQLAQSKPPLEISHPEVNVSCEGGDLSLQDVR